MAASSTLLPPSVSSPHDIAALVLEIRLYAKWYAQYSNANKVHAAYSQPQPQLSPVAGDIIRAWHKEKALTPARLDDLIALLEKTAKSAPMLFITLAAPVTVEVKEQLVQWARTNLRDDILVTFHFNRAILGGMVIRVGSSIFDWSFKRKLLEGQTQLSKVLSHV